MAANDVNYWLVAIVIGAIVLWAIYHYLIRPRRQSLRKNDRRKNKDEEE